MMNASRLLRHGPSIMTNYSIRTLITIGPIFLLLLSTLVLTVSRYYSELQSEAQHNIELASVSLQPILNLMKPSVGGGNYANVLDAQAVSLYQANSKILHFEVNGNSDKQNERFGMIYDHTEAQVLRSAYPEGHATDLKERIDSIEKKIERIPAENKKREKIEKILANNKATLATYEKEQAVLNKLSQKYQRPEQSSFSSGHYLDKKQWLLHVLAPTGNSGGGEIWVIMDASSMGELATTIIKRIIPLVLGVTLIVGILLWQLASRVSHSISGLHKTISDVEQRSDLTLRARIEYSDEVGETAKAFNAMIDNFDSLIQDVSQAGYTLQKSTEELFSISDQNSDGVRRQQQGIDSVASAVTQLSGSVQEVANHAHEASAAASEAVQASDEGLAVVQQVVNSINSLSDEIKNAAKVIADVGTAAENIDSIIEVIKSVAEQTNLLALNAAIEAARAGEQGRGFSVVADEVRNLANRTQASTDEINHMVCELQNGTKSAVAAMAHGCEQVTSSVELAARAGNSLSVITNKVDKINQMNLLIADSASQQSMVADEISQHVNSISSVADESIHNTEKMVENSKELQTLSKNMLQRVAQFRN